MKLISYIILTSMVMSNVFYGLVVMNISEIKDDFETSDIFEKIKMIY